METEIRESTQELFQVIKDNLIHVGLNLIFKDIKLAGSISEGSFAARLFQTDPDFPDFLHREIELDLEMTMFEFENEFKSTVREVEGQPGFLRMNLLENGHINVPNEVIKFFEASTTPTELQYFMDSDGYLLSNRIKAVYSWEMFDGKLDHNLIKITKMVASYITKTPIDQISNPSVNSKFTKATTTFGFDLYIKNQLQLKTSSDFAFVFKLNFPLNIYEELLKRWQNTSIPVQSLTQELNIGYIIAKPSNEDRNDLSSTGFRYSFAHIERKLIQLQSPEKRKVYLIFKSLLYSELKPIDPDHLSSYICKCTMFWFIESHGSWSNEPTVILKVLENLLRNLLEYFERKFMPYYFVPQINVLSHLSNQTIDKVIKKLKIILEQPQAYLKRSQIEKAGKFLQDFISSTNIVKNLIKEIKENGPYMFFLERPDLYNLLKDHHKNSQLGYHQRKKINRCQLQSPFEADVIAVDKQCSMRRPLRSMIFDV